MRSKFVIGWQDDSHEWAKVHELHEIVKELRCICKALQPPQATNFQLVQGENMGAITGVQAGSSDFFTASLIPSNAVALQSGPVFSTDDSQVTLTPDTTNPFKVVAAVGAGDTGASFNLKVDGVNGAGTAITHTFIIPIIAAPPPQALDFDLSQGA